MPLLIQQNSSVEIFSHSGKLGCERGGVLSPGEGGGRGVLSINSTRFYGIHMQHFEPNGFPSKASRNVCSFKAFQQHDCGSFKALTRRGRGR